LAEGEVGEIDSGDGLAAVIEEAGDAPGGLGQALKVKHGNDFDDAACLERVAVVAEMKKQEQHC
jgi:hypothetical protein